MIWDAPPHVHEAAGLEQGLVGALTDVLDRNGGSMPLDQLRSGLVTESAKALAGTIQGSRYLNSSFRLLAGQFWLGKFGWTHVAVPI